MLHHTYIILQTPFCVRYIFTKCLLSVFSLLQGFVLLLVFSPSCVLSQDVNFTATTEMAEYTFIAGTTQAPQPTSSPNSAHPPFTRMNSSDFDLFYEIYLNAQNITIKHPHQECMYRQAMEKQLLEFDLGEKGMYGVLACLFCFTLFVLIKVNRLDEYICEHRR